jgi:hypothetical protein
MLSLRAATLEVFAIDRSSCASDFACERGFVVGCNVAGIVRLAETP